MLKPETKRKLTEIVGDGHILTATEDMICYSSDATAIDGQADAVVLPLSAKMVSDIVKLANEESFAVIPRGAGTGNSGGCVPFGGGILLDLSLMNKIVEVDSANLVAIVQPGVITAQFQAEVEKRGLFYPPDPGSQKTSTIGGNVAECSGGPRGVKYGVTKDYVIGLEVVMPTGEILRAGGKTIKNVTGYDLTKLFIGSEGTLCVITEITLRLLPLPKHKGTMMAAFPSVEEAGSAVSQIIATGTVPSKIELMDNQAIRCVEDYVGMGLPIDAEAILLIEVDGEKEAIDKQLPEIANLCRQNGAYKVDVAETLKQASTWWAARQAVPAALAKLSPNRMNEDIVVPRSVIPQAIARIHEIRRKYSVPIVVYGHAGDGNLHPNILYDRRNPAEIERAHEVAGAIFAAAVELGGTLSGEHGIGLSKKDFLGTDVGTDVIEVMRKIKAALDPNSVLNPGKIFGYN